MASSSSKPGVSKSNKKSATGGTANLKNKSSKKHSAASSSSSAKNTSPPDLSPVLAELLGEDKIEAVDSVSFRTKDEDIACVFSLSGSAVSRTEVLFRFGSLTPTYDGYLAMLYLKSGQIKTLRGRPVVSGGGGASSAGVSPPGAGGGSSQPAGSSSTAAGSNKDLFAGKPTDLRPVDASDPLDYFMFACPKEPVTSLVGSKNAIGIPDLGRGVFVFSKAVLLENGIVTGTVPGNKQGDSVNKERTSKGKNAFRIWPPSVDPKTLKTDAARKTQQWQRPYFVAFDDKHGKRRGVEVIRRELFQLLGAAS